MSDDPSNISKDPNKGSKKKNSGTNADLKQQPRKGSKDYQVYFEAKGSEKPSKDQSNTSKGASSSNNLDEHHGQKSSNKQKSYAKNRKESRDQGPNAWRKKYPRVSKEVIIEFYLTAPSHKDIDEFVTTCSQLFVKEKQIPVNKEDNQLDASEGLILKTYPPQSHGHAHSTTHTSSHTTANSTADLSAATTSANVAENTATTTTAPTITPASTTAPVNTSTQPVLTAAPSKPVEQAEAPVNLNDPIQAMRERMKRDKLNKEKKELEARAAAQKTENIPTTENKPKEENKVEVKKENIEEARADFDDKEKENKNSSNQSEETLQNANQMQKGVIKEEKLTTTETQQPAKTQKDESDVLRAQNEKLDSNRSPTRDSGVDFSKLSFDTDTKGSLSDDFNAQQGDAYGSASGRNAQQRMYQDANMIAGNNANYNNQDMNQNMSRGVGAQQMQQVNTQYANKNYMQEQASPSLRRDSPGSFSNIPKQTTPPSVVFKYFSPNYEDKVWSYIDLEGKFQGPFSGRTMDDWYGKGYLPVELSVTIGKGNGFKTLKDLIDIIVNHNTQGESPSPMSKGQTPPKMPSQEPQYQQQQQYYQQQQQQQPQRQYQQYQQQPQPQPQYQQQYQQQNQYQQQQQQQRPYYQQQSDYSQYGSTTPTASANRSRVMEGYENNMYYGNQGSTSQYGSQGNVLYGKVTEIADPQTHAYYSNSQYYQEPTQKTANYGTYKQGTNASASGYYQDPAAYNANYGQTGYNQPQKAVQKPNYPAQMQNYPSGNQMGSYGGNFGTQTMNTGMGGQVNSKDFTNYGTSPSNTQMYSMQQQQMINRTPSMGGSGNMGMNPNMPNDITMQLKNMLGMARPSSRQDGTEY